MTTDRGVPSSFGPARRMRVFEDVAAQIRAEVSKGHFRAGQRLASERELCEKFKVSRNTLREALRSLENAGLLEFRKGAAGGAYIAQVQGDVLVTGLQDMIHLGVVEPEELIRARIWFESAAIRAAVTLITDEELAAMADNIEQAVEASRQGDFEGRVRINIDFHRMIARATRNRVVVTMLEALLQATFVLILHVGPYDDGFIAPARRKFLKAFAARDAEGAVAEMERQLSRLQRVYSKVLGDRAKEAATAALTTSLTTSLTTGANAG